MCCCLGLDWLIGPGRRLIGPGQEATTGRSEPDSWAGRPLHSGGPAAAAGGNSVVSPSSVFVTRMESACVDAVSNPSAHDCVCALDEGYVPLCIGHGPVRPNYITC